MSLFWGDSRFGGDFLAKVEVAGSIPVIRSTKTGLSGRFSWFPDLRVVANGRPRRSRTQCLYSSVSEMVNPPPTTMGR